MTVVYIVRTEVAPGHDDAWRRWQEEEHIGSLLALPGYLGVQRFAETARPGSYLNVWRLATREAQGTEEYRRASLTPWFERIRPFYDVTVTFGLEVDCDDPHGPSAWRDQVTALVVERADPDGGSAITASGLPADYEAGLASQPGVAHVIRLTPLAPEPPPEWRSAPSDVLLIHLSSEVALPDPPPGVERRCYRAVAPYMPST